jgi:hypothetical protein
MDPGSGEELEERNALWLSLTALRPEIERLALGEWDTSERQYQVVTLLARIVLAELDFRTPRNDCE